ncbi:efflux RND transporter periplasmic adaptor subunit [Oceaniserpentilla sp. 4NH20-0058]|uniref:efflux RND transporter periplasmic adaptor subunit n=1 Tax=Oceaniserpentilla sp. 4NH20-0058 TaxID=3127660 RepID=UPI0031041F6E
MHQLTSKYMRNLLGLLLITVPTILFADTPMPVEVIKVKPQILKSTINSIGTLEANQSVTISPEVSGRITSVSFKDGAHVNIGQLLFKLDNSIETANLNEAKARAQLSHTELKRIQKLYKQKAASETDLDSAAANHNIYQAQVQSFQAKLNKLSIKAPFTGVIDINNISIGDYVNAGENLIKLVDLTTLKFDFALPETYLSKVAVGQNIEITTPAYPGEIYQGTVSAVSPAINEETRSLAVRAIIDNQSQTLRPGLFASVILEVNRNPSALLLPEQALVPQGQSYVVMKVVNNKVEITPIEIGTRRKSEVEIITGINEGDIIITAGQMKVQPGVKVKALFPDALKTDK